MHAQKILRLDHLINEINKDQNVKQSIRNLNADMELQTKYLTALNETQTLLNDNEAVESGACLGIDTALYTRFKKNRAFEKICITIDECKR